MFMDYEFIGEQGLYSQILTESITPYITHGKVSIPIYNTDCSGLLIEGEEDREGSFFHEYHFKLKKIYKRIYTKRGREIGEARKEIVINFYEALHMEISSYCKPISDILKEL